MFASVTAAGAGVLISASFASSSVLSVRASFARYAIWSLLKLPTTALPSAETVPSNLKPRLVVNVTVLPVTLNALTDIVLNCGAGASTAAVGLPSLTSALTMANACSLPPRGE